MAATAASRADLVAVKGDRLSDITLLRHEDFV